MDEAIEVADADEVNDIDLAAESAPAPPTPTFLQSLLALLGGGAAAARVASARLFCSPRQLVLGDAHRPAPPRGRRLARCMTVRMRLVLELSLPPPSFLPRGFDVSRLKLSLACGLYDRTDALRTGDVKVDGIDIDFIAISNPREIFDRMGGKQEFDVSEFSSSEFISRLGRGDKSFVALPVFPSRVFRHGYIYINRKAGIREPKDIAGKRVGVPVYTMTAAVWIRGHLMHQYGVDLSGCRWIEGAINHAGSHGEPSAPPLLKPIKVERDPQGRSLSELLAKGEIDVIMGTQHPIPHPDIAPLFPDARAVERAFAKTTRIFPMMHLVVIRRDVHERDPSIADRLYKGFVDAKNLALSRLKRGHPLMLPWLHQDVHELDEVFGGDPYPCGIEANRPSLDALMQYMVEQNFIARPIPLEDVFVPVDKSHALTGMSRR